MEPHTVARRIAELVMAIRNCQKTGNTEWEATHTERLNAIVWRHLPSGGGFDNGTKIDMEKTSDTRLVFNTSFHHMNEHGYYVRWTEHSVIVTPTFTGPNVHVTGRNYRDIKDYIAEAFYGVMVDKVQPE